MDGNNSQREKGPTRGGQRLFVYCGLCLKAGVWEARAALMNWETRLVGWASGEIPQQKMVPLSPVLIDQEFTENWGVGRLGKQRTWVLLWGKRNMHVKICRASSGKHTTRSQFGTAGPRPSYLLARKEIHISWESKKKERTFEIPMQRVSLPCVSGSHKVSYSLGVTPWSHSHCKTKAVPHTLLPVPDHVLPKGFHCTKSNCDDLNCSR